MGDHALVDTAAGQALIGKDDLSVMKEAFERRGFRILVKEGTVPGVTASGIGVRVEPVARAWVPVSLWRCGIVEFLVLPHRCPPLLPARLLEAMKA
eukprot:6987001-Pyramimonas_sp.AAC.1